MRIVICLIALLTSGVPCWSQTSLDAIFMVGNKAERYLRCASGRPAQLHSGADDMALDLSGRHDCAALFWAEGAACWSRAARDAAGPERRVGRGGTAGAIERRLVGPICKQGRLVTELWVGDPQDLPLATGEDFERASSLVALGGISATVLATAFLLMVRT